MQDPSGSRAGRGSRHTRGQFQGRGALLGLAVIASVVGVAAILAVALGGPGLPAVASAEPFGSDFPLVPTPAPTPTTSGGSVATAPVAASPSLSASPATVGVRARQIQIPALGIDLKIVEGDGIDAPIGKAAHYPGSGWPGGGTNIYLYAHAQKGMFLSLWNASVGDQVILTLVDGTQRTYTVDKVLPKVPWNAVEYLDPTPAEQLTLQTSTSYTATAPRFVVIARPLP